MTSPEDGPRLFDTHCHLQDPKFDADRDAALNRALDGLEGLVIVGDDLENSRRAVDLCGPKVYAAVGFHPYHGGDITPDSLTALRELASQPGVVALGEIGLDNFRYCETPRDVQLTAFEAQLDLAATLHLPVVIHNRDAHEDIAAVLASWTDRMAGGIMHCFAGDAAFAMQCVEWGFHVSFAGNVTFPKAKDLREAAAQVPLDRLLVETDSPYLAPQPVRGKRCEPAFVRYTAEEIAVLRGMSLQDLAKTTTANAHRLFGLDNIES